MITIRILDQLTNDDIENAMQRLKLLQQALNEASKNEENKNEEGGVAVEFVREVFRTEI